jgi:hypothetical protein
MCQTLLTARKLLLHEPLLSGQRELLQSTQRHAPEHPLREHAVHHEQLLLPNKGHPVLFLDWFVALPANHRAAGHITGRWHTVRRAREQDKHPCPACALHDTEITAALGASCAATPCHHDALLLLALLACNIAALTAAVDITCWCRAVAQRSLASAPLAGVSTTCHPHSQPPPACKQTIKGFVVCIPVVCSAALTPGSEVHLHDNLRSCCCCCGVLRTELHTPEPSRCSPAPGTARRLGPCSTGLRPVPLACAQTLRTRPCLATQTAWGPPPPECPHPPPCAHCPTSTLGSACAHRAQDNQQTQYREQGQAPTAPLVLLLFFSNVPHQQPVQKNQRMLSCCCCCMSSCRHKEASRT